jgi:two-component sensor histidine kinase
MHPPTLPPSPVPPPSTPGLPVAPAPSVTAVAALLGRFRQHAARTLAFTALMCVCIAGVLAVIEGGRFGVKLVYSFSIGAACLLTIHAARLAWAALDDGVRRVRGQPPDPSRHADGWHGIVPSVMLGVVIGPLLGTGLADTMLGVDSPSLWQLESSSTRITLVMTVIASLVATYVLGALERLASARAQAEAAQRQAAEHQLRLLQSQLQPHMLFNTLANLRVLIGVDPRRAQAMLDRLNAYLRATLAASRQDEHPLHVEFDRLADYLALMAVRMGPRLQVVVDLPETLRSAMVPPLLLQPLVENAIQHGLEPKIDGGRIEVRARRDGADLVLSVRDTGVGLPSTGPQRAGNFGVAQVHERLSTLYGTNAQLTLENVEGVGGTADLDDAASAGALATVRLPLRDATTGAAR